LSTALVVDPFKEEEEGISIASDIVKVKGEDPAPRGNRARWYVGDPFRGYVLLGPPLRKPQDSNNSPMSVKYNKHHTQLKSTTVILIFHDSLLANLVVAEVIVHSNDSKTLIFKADINILLVLVCSEIFNIGVGDKASAVEGNF